MVCKRYLKKNTIYIQSKNGRRKRVSPSVPYGYFRNPKNKQELLVDKESAKVVKRIYNLVIEGYGVTQIADILTKDKVLIPSAYAEIHYPEKNHSSKKRGIEDHIFGHQP